MGNARDTARGTGHDGHVDRVDVHSTRAVHAGGHAAGSDCAARTVENYFYADRVVEFGLALVFAHDNPHYAAAAAAVELVIR